MGSQRHQAHKVTNLQPARICRLAAVGLRLETLANPAKNAKQISRTKQEIRHPSSERLKIQDKVINNAKEKLKLGKRFPLTNFNLIYDGEKQSGIILSGSGCDNNSVKQRSIKSYFSRMIGKNKKRKKSTTYKQQEEV